MDGPDYQDGGGRVVYCGDALAVLRALPSESVNMCVTSPPYWGLRDYGTAQWEGGDAECDHVHRREARKAASGSSTLGIPADGGPRRITDDNAYFTESKTQQYRDICGKCGAVRIDNQLGLEPTPEQYVAKMVAVFEEVRRVLRRDGTCWVNMGDSYANDGKWGGETGGKQAYLDDNNRKRVGREKRQTGLKPKDLIGMPWMLAFALRDAGWYLRQDIIWHKPNPMPESVRDRCTKAHEYLFLLSKSARYYWDAEAIAEKSDRVMANKRSVWTIVTEPYPAAHFATFPTKLVEPCVLAGCPEGGVVLDPFAGSGTTLQVARDLGRAAIGIELNREYIKLIEKRLQQRVLF